MSIKETLSTLSQKDGELFTIRGYISYDEKIGVTIRYNDDTFAVVSENDIDTRCIFPLGKLEDPEGGGKRSLIKVKRGALVELHHKTLTHRFILDPENERQFVLDEDECRIR